MFMHMYKCSCICINMIYMYKCIGIKGGQAHPLVELIRARLVQPLFEQHLPEALIQVRKRLGLPAASL